MFDDVITITGISGGHHPEFPEDPEWGAPEVLWGLRINVFVCGVLDFPKFSAGFSNGQAAESWFLMCVAATCVGWPTSPCDGPTELLHYWTRCWS